MSWISSIIDTIKPYVGDAAAIETGNPAFAEVGNSGGGGGNVTSQPSQSLPDISGNIKYGSELFMQDITEAAIYIVIGIIILVAIAAIIAPSQSEVQSIAGTAALAA